MVLADFREPCLDLRESQKSHKIILKVKSMSREIFFVVHESPEGGFEAEALNHSIYTEADTLEDLRAMIKDAVQCHFEPETRPELIRLHFVREEVLATA